MQRYPPPPTRYGAAPVQRRASAPPAGVAPPPTKFGSTAAQRQIAGPSPRAGVAPPPARLHAPLPPGLRGAVPPVRPKPVLTPGMPYKASEDVAQAYWAAGLALAGVAIGGIATGGIGYVAAGLGLAGAAIGAYLDSSGDAVPAAVGGGGGHLGGGGPAPYAPLTNRVFAQDPVGEGGAYGRVKGFSLRNVREADHTPPKSTYAGTPYAGTAENAMPAVSIDYSSHRRGVSGGGGGVTTTGSHALVVHYRDNFIHNYLAAGNFCQAMIVALNDQKNAAPNALYYAEGQRKAAEYARQIGLLASDLELARVIEAIERISF